VLERESVSCSGVQSCRGYVTGITQVALYYDGARTISADLIPV
jgi:hypothetical protein